MLRRVVALTLFLLSTAALAQSAVPVTVIQGATIIDGTGAAPLKNHSVIIRGDRITEITRDVPEDLGDATIIKAKGKYLLPGFIDSNVHASVYGNSRRRETAVKYAQRNHELVEEFAQRQLKYGVTTFRDSYGSLYPLMQVRDGIARGDIIGSRMLVAGNIVGWGGPFSLTFSLMRESDLTLFQEQWNDLIAQGVGEELMDMGPEELRQAMETYLDKGPDFIKYGGTSHFRFPSLIGFSPRQQKVIVDATHERGKIAETHATSAESLRLAVEAGIDLIQHPEILSTDYPEDLLQMIVQRDVICAMRSNTLAGRPWQEHLQSKGIIRDEIQQLPPAATSAERRRRQSRLGHDYEIQRRNAERLIEAGCRVTIATDNYQGRAPEFRREPKATIQEAGIGSLLAIEGLVELGMTPMDAIVAATRNGAIAAGALEDYGTIEVGKSADLVLLAKNPLRKIHHIHLQDMVMMRGTIIDTTALPLQRIFYTGD